MTIGSTRIWAVAAALVAAGLVSGSANGATYTFGAQPDNAIKTLAGIVNGDGSIIAGKGFTVKHNSTGNYTITTPPFTKFPAMVVTPTSVSGVSQVANVGATSCNSTGCTFNVLIVTILNSADDSAFSFYAVST